VQKINIDKGLKVDYGGLEKFEFSMFALLPVNGGEYKGKSAMGRKAIDDVRKPQILKHFKEVIAEVGFHNASISRVANRMGVSSNLIVHYFKSKEEMVLELFEDYMDEFIGALRSSVKGKRMAKERLKGLITGLLRMPSENNEERINENVHAALYYISFNNDEIRLRMAKRFEGMNEFIVNEIRRAMNEGVLQGGDPEKLAEIIISLSEGFVFLSNLRTDGDYYEEFMAHLYEKVWMLLSPNDSIVMDHL